MLKKFLMGTAAVAFAATLAAASNIPLITGPQDPSQLTAVVNSLIQSINFGVNGRLTSVVTPAQNTTTAEQTLGTYTLPANRIANTGDAVKVKCWGGFAANSDAKLLKIYFGTTSFSTSTITATPNGKSFEADLLVMRTGAATQSAVSKISVDLTATTTQTSITGADSWAANQTIKCTSTSAASSDITLQGMIVEQVK